MRRLSLVSIFMLLIFLGFQDMKSPHGKDFKLSCKDCHTTSGWKVDPANYTYDHNTSNMPLFGQHQSLACKDCHTSLVFSDADQNCISCHGDIHQGSVGFDCQDCHNEQHWLVNNVFEIHLVGRFPLLGAHQQNDCEACHPSASKLNFEPLGVECVDCHLVDYNASTSPNHSLGGFSKECIDCHKVNAYMWKGGGINHDFFPLIKGHQINDCYECHEIGTNYSNINNDCFVCHESDYNSSSNPSHVSANIPTSCEDCHSIEPGWEPASFEIHNTYYAIVGAHTSVVNDCNVCHNGSYNNTPNTCFGCHEDDYNRADDPPHQASDLPTDCLLCHSQNAWEPASFTNHSEFFPIVGAHTSIANDCAACHNGNYTETPNTCIGCHENDYNGADDPPHQSSGFSTDCLECHNQNAWDPSTFQHDSQYFPIYSGSHNGEWDQCSDCHTTPSNYGLFSCIDCHEHNQSEMNGEHDDVNNYQYNSMACFECHPQGREEDNLMSYKSRKYLLR